jgi:hypothetical protein
MYGSAQSNRAGIHPRGTQYELQTLNTGVAIVKVSKSYITSLSYQSHC